MSHQTANTKPSLGVLESIELREVWLDVRDFAPWLEALPISDEPGEPGADKP